MEIGVGTAVPRWLWAMMLGITGVWRPLCAPSLCAASSVLFSIKLLEGIGPLSAQR